jgi:hypothetical protein
MAKKSVPVLITWDVDPLPLMPLDRKRWALNAAMDMCHRQGIHATFFFTAQPAHVYLDYFERMQVQGHEIGCHGLTHRDEEDYNRMSEEMQRAYIAGATERLQALTGGPIRAFRSPRVKTSARTLKLLAENGYLADSSVCAQRVDLVSANLINTGWIFSPRRPYRPHRNSAFRAGDVPIWEIPVSAAVVPFISTALQVLGLSPMKVLFKLLYAESQHTGKPIVYLAHPAESVSKKGRPWAAAKRQYFTLSYIRTHGLQLRRCLYRIYGEDLYKNTQELFAYIASFPDVEFMTVSEYAVNRLGNTS